MRKLTLIPGAMLALVLVFNCGNSNPQPEIPTIPAPAAPANLHQHNETETSLTFQWNAVEQAASYAWELQKDGAKVDEGSVRTRNVTVSGLTKATDYRFGVKAVNESGASSMTWVDARTSGTVDPEPPTPGPSEQYYAEFAIPDSEEDGVARAFPGAEGGGMYTTGGRGGKVYHVTKLEDSSVEGTLRYGIEKGERPLTIVFDVAGIIALQSDLKIQKGNLTIAGQTAPGDGICLKNYTTNIAADNVIIRFLRFRLGDEAPWTAAEIEAGKADGEDCIWGRYNKGIIIDHCSMSWSVDECASFYANANFTLQWCLIAESMKNCKLHSKGSHGYGGIWGGKDASFHHNLLAHHDNRTPRFDHQYLYEGNGVSTQEYRGNVDFRNCVSYNWGKSNGCYGGEGGHYNLVNNYLKAGGNSNDKPYFIEADGGYSTGGTQYGYDWAYLYLSGNYSTQYPSGSSKYPDGIYWKKAYSDYNLPYDGHLLSAPLSLSGPDRQSIHTTTHSAADALARVCSWGGASLRRDAVDTRICEQVQAGTGSLVDDIAAVRSAYGAAWPAYTASPEELARVKDSDQDGLPDWFETQFGLNKSDKSDGALISLDVNKRYTNLEMYLHYLVKDIVSGGNAGGTYTKL